MQEYTVDGSPGYVASWGHNGPCAPGCTCTMASPPQQRVLPCLICGSALEPITPGDWQPQATIFRASGNYGSGVFDPDDQNTHLAVNVCDGCLAKAGKDGRVELLTYPRQPRPAPKRERWTAGEGREED